eukprot:CAMPEP_0113927484 /NCGR_PEP_ID=MMETSP1159-20121227/4327_1 /TAXON_ID=88271 /ORGANISM="Picocystis salinarum" /LENGTH=71 /DNA_ID=CAMNT_0000927975 /DNA_START=703 /DNA_END=919 /DNA_ORIENTATION=- /assembly_acc=CAM_ASM_000767
MEEHTFRAQPLSLAVAWSSSSNISQLMTAFIKSPSGAVLDLKSLDDPSGPHVMVFHGMLLECVVYPYFDAV